MVGPTRAGRPLLSILIPSFNQGPYLKDTLESTLAQDYRPIEVLVMDGGSTDETVPLLRSYARDWPELRWWSEPDRGVAHAVNKAMQRATGLFAGIQSADDIYLPGAFTSAMSVLESDETLGIVYGDGAFMDATGSTLLSATHYPPFSMQAFLLRQTILLQSSCFFRLDIARAVGGWRESCFVADLDLWLRMAFETRVRKLDRCLSAWRSHPGQRNENAAEIWGSYWKSIDECEPLRRSKLRHRLAARAGRRLFTEHYNPRQSFWFVRYQLWMAVLGYPPALSAMPYKAHLIPGLARAMNLARRAGLLAEPMNPSPAALDLHWWASEAVG